MPPAAPSHRQRFIHGVFLVAVFTVLFANIRFDVFHTVPKERFLVFQADSQALAEQKIYEVAQSGKPDPARGFLVRSKEMETVRLTGKSPAQAPADGEIYRSQFGLQGAGYTFLQLVTRGPGSRTVGFAETLVAAATASLLLCIVWIILQRSGVLAAALGAVPLVFSPTLVLAGRNLYWALPFIMLPFVAVLLCYWRGGLTRTSLKRAGLVVALVVFLKCLCGYEYITCLCLLPAVALSVILARDGFREWRTFLIHSAVLFVAACVGFVCAMLVHYLFVAWAVGDFGAALDAILGRAKAHIGALDVHDEVQAKYRNGVAGMVLMIVKYLTFPGIFVGAEVSIGDGSYTLLAASFAGMVLFCVLVSVAKFANSGDWRIAIGPAFVSVLALAASISWLVAARGHALHHFHLNSMAFLPLIMAFPLALLISPSAPCRHDPLNPSDAGQG